MYSVSIYSTQGKFNTLEEPLIRKYICWFTRSVNIFFSTVKTKNWIFTLNRRPKRKINKNIHTKLICRFSRGLTFACHLTPKTVSEEEAGGLGYLNVLSPKMLLPTCWPITVVYRWDQSLNIQTISTKKHDFVWSSWCIAQTLSSHVNNVNTECLNLRRHPCVAEHLKAPLRSQFMHCGSGLHWGLQVLTPSKENCMRQT